MSVLKNIVIKNFRNISKLDLSFDSNNVCFYGENAQGKTNIIEAIYLLANTKSFRYSQLNDLINFNKKKALFSSNLYAEDIGTFSIDYEINKNKKTYKLNEKPIKTIKDIYRVLRVVAYIPSSFQIILASEGYKRVFFDKVAFSIDYKHLDNLVYYNKLIKNRNLLIKQGKKFYYYDELIAEIGEQIVNLRTKALSEVKNYCKDSFSLYFPEIKDFDISYKAISGTSKEEILNNLRKCRIKDQNYQCSQMGVHRDYFEIKVGGVNVKKHMSTGQSKLLALLFKLAKIKIINQYSKIKPVFLFDDVGAFLDEKRFTQVVDNINNINSQIFFTSVDICLFQTRFFDSVQMLKVKNGEVENG